MSEYDAAAFDAYEQAGWEAIAGRFNECWSPITSQAIDALLDAAHVGQGSRVLDVGTGAGDAARYAVARGAEATGVDVAAAMVEIAVRRNPKATFVQAAATDLPFADGSFDAVVGNNVIQHIGEPGQAALRAKTGLGSRRSHRIVELGCSGALALLRRRAGSCRERRGAGATRGARRSLVLPVHGRCGVPRVA